MHGWLIVKGAHLARVCGVDKWTVTYRDDWCRMRSHSQSDDSSNEEEQTVGMTSVNPGRFDRIDRRLLEDALQESQRYHTERTLREFHRMNPYTEDLFPWKSRAEAWPGADEGVTIYGSTTLNGHVTIGKHTWIGPFCSLDGSAPLAIGEYCSVSAGVQILTHDTVKWALSGGLQGAERAPVTIGNRCFLGTLSVVTRGVVLGDMCLIGEGAVVTHSFPERSVIAGVPGRVIGTVIGSGDRISVEYFC